MAITLLVLVGALLGGQLFGVLVRYLVTWFLIYSGWYARLMDFLSGPAPDSCISVLGKEKPRTVNPCELVMDGSVRWKL